MLEGKQPDTVVAASVLFYARHGGASQDIKEGDIANAAKIAQSTLKNAFKTLEENENRKALLDRKWE